MSRLLQGLLFISFLLSIPATVIAAPQVVVTIKPIHSLVANVMQGISTPQLLIKGNHSPHTFTLKPSQMRQLENADIIFWVGESLETSLQKTLHHAEEDQQVVELIETPGLQQLAPRSEHKWIQKSLKANASEHQHQHNLSIDPHIWLSPFNASKMVQHISNTLIKLDPENAKQYQENTQQTLQRIQQLDQQISHQLSPLSKRPFVVFHDAYQHFERHYQLKSIAAVTLSPDRLPGARHISDIKKRIKELNVVCIFNETQFSSQLVNSITEGSQLRTGSLDPLGATLTAGTDAWFELMKNLSNSISGCLSANQE
jgi:zinc transport system substrate-binding protein